MESNIFEEKECYREKIIEMVQKINDVEFLEMIYGFTRTLYKKEAEA